MTKNSKRRAWTPTQVRTLKTLARKKTHVIWPRMDKVASHGQRGISAILLGSETLKVLTHSAIPVIVRRRPSPATLRDSFAAS